MKEGFDPFQVNVPSQNPSLMFSGAAEREFWPEMSFLTSTGWQLVVFLKTASLKISQILVVESVFHAVVAFETTKIVLHNRCF